MHDMLIVGYNEHSFLDEGWHDREVDTRNQVVFRSSRECASFHLDAEPRHKTLILLLSAQPTLSPENEIHVRILSNNSPIGECSFRDDDWHLVRFPISISEKGNIGFTLSVSPMVIPHTRFANGDFRTLGISLAAARLAME